MYLFRISQVAQERVSISLLQPFPRCSWCNGFYCCGWATVVVVVATVVVVVVVVGATIVDAVGAEHNTFFTALGSFKSASMIPTVVVGFFFEEPLKLKS